MSYSWFKAKSKGRKTAREFIAPYRKGRNTRGEWIWDVITKKFSPNIRRMIKKARIRRERYMAP